MRCTWNSERCVRYRDVALKAIFPTVAVVLAMWIGWLFYPRGQERWAEIEQIHLRWDQGEQKLRISMVFKKNAECDQVYVSKHLIPITKDGVLIGTNPIPLHGNLDKQMLQVKKGRGTVELFDEAVVEDGKITPGNTYQFTIVATCEQNDRHATLPAEALSTAAVRKTITAQSGGAPWTWMSTAFLGVS
jgi:hypothetical protein